jgi:penicillin-binding protein 2
LASSTRCPGQDLRLTIDNDLQRAAELALGNRNGAIVAMDPRNGEILAMVSRPSFDPNEFAVKIDRADWNKLVTDPDHPLLNKAIQAQLAPGSTFKILMSVAGLAGRHCAGHAYCVHGGWGPYGYYHHCDEHHGRGGHLQRDSRIPATRSITCSAISWASTAL